MRKIGLMGGTFEPIHVGHILLGQWAYEAFDLDEVWFMPTGVSYLKKDREMLGSKERLELTRIAVEGLPHFSVTDIEARRPGETYTSDTLQELRSLYPEDRFYFLCGGDSLEYFPNWYQPDQILANCEMIAATRHGSENEKLMELASSLPEKLKVVSTYGPDFGGRIHILSFPNFEISSTDIRNRVKEGKSIHFLVPEKVEQIILEKGYFQ